MGTPETYHRVLVPLDGSPLAEAILPFVSRLARPLGLEIALLRVVPTVAPKIVPMNQGSTPTTVLTDDQPATFNSTPRGKAIVMFAHQPRCFVRSGGTE